MPGNTWEGGLSCSGFASLDMRPVARPSKPSPCPRCEAAGLPYIACRVGRSAEKLADASTELEKVLAIALATTQQIPRSDAHLRPLSDAVVKCAAA